MKDIDNFSRIEERPGVAGSPVGFGGATEPSAMPWLKSEGFAAVINLRLAEEPGAKVEECRVAAEETGLKYIHLPLDPRNPDAGIVDKFVAAISDETNQPVYIYCNTATRVAALWMIVACAGGWLGNRRGARRGQSYRSQARRGYRIRHQIHRVARELEYYLQCSMHSYGRKGSSLVIFMAGNLLDMGLRLTIGDDLKGIKKLKANSLQVTVD